MSVETLNVLRCVTCRINLTDDASKYQHYRCDWHKYNLKRKVAGRPPISLSLFEENLAKVRRNQAMVEQRKLVIYKCNICRKTFKSEGSCETHLNTKKHKQKLNEECQRLKVSEIPLNEIISSQIQDTESVASQEPVYPLEAIPLKHCLFCPRADDTLSDSLDHMLNAHGFAIPFIQHVCSLEGLILFLGRSIGEGGECPTCKKHFHSLQGVWAHMDDKNHCKLVLPEYEETLYDEFYDFSREKGSEHSAGSIGIEPQVRELNNRRPVAVNEFDELVLSDGSTIGHRNLQRVYNQAIRPEDSRACVVIPKLQAHYKALCMPGYGIPYEQDKQKMFREYTRKTEQFRMRHQLRANNQKHFKDTSLHF